MGIVALIRAALEAFLELSKDFKLMVAAYQKAKQIEFLALKAKALQDIQSATSEADYKAAAKALHEAISQL